MKIRWLFVDLSTWDHQDEIALQDLDPKIVDFAWFSFFRWLRFDKLLITILFSFTPVLTLSFSIYLQIISNAYEIRKPPVLLPISSFLIKFSVRYEHCINFTKPLHLHAFYSLCFSVKVIFLRRWTKEKALGVQPAVLVSKWKKF